MPHLHLQDAKRTQTSKVQGIVGHTENYTFPPERAAGLAHPKDQPYFENRKLDPLSIETSDKAWP